MFLRILVLLFFLCPHSSAHSSFLSFRAEPIRLALLAQDKLRGVEESLGAPEFREAIRA